jgi:hypothetical protein
VKNLKKSKFIRRFLLIVISIFGFSIAFNNFILLSKDIIFGDFSGEKVFPQPFTGLWRIPDRVNAIEHNAVDRLAVDYAQVYFPSQEFSSLTRNYETGYLDPWERPSRYAPFVHYFCSISFCKLDYGYASFLHMFIQTLLFFFFFIIAFKMLEIESDLWFGLLLVAVLLFATPAGLGWLERGQFSLYVAISYLLLILGFLKNKPVLILVSALFAYVKWTSFPFLLVVFIVFLLSSKNRKEGVRNIQFALTYILIILLLSLSFRSKFIHFIEGLYTQELYVQPTGISLAQLLPAAIVKGLPFILIFLGYLYLRRNNKNFDQLIPYLIGCGILLLIYPTVAFEYNIPNLFCFIPLVFYWTKNSSPMSKTIRYAFFLFIFLISFPNFLGSFVSVNTVLVGYLVVSIVFLLFPYLLPGELSFQSLKENNV